MRFWRTQERASHPWCEYSNILTDDMNATLHLLDTFFFLVSVTCSDLNQYVMHAGKQELSKGLLTRKSKRCQHEDHYLAHT